MADFSSLVNAMEKLNNFNYNNWSTRMYYYLLGQDLWDIVGGNNTTPPTNDSDLRKWNVKSGKALYVLAVTVEDELLQHIKSAKTPKEAWDNLAALFARTNDANLQCLENEPLSISQQSMTVITEVERNEPAQSEDPNSMEENVYDVFLSFKGKDTRNSFTDYLDSRLVNAGINVFQDTNKLRVGEEIDLVLFRSIRQSKILIPIISENYAFSKWCLRELAMMLECKRNERQIVLPIFYKVEPSQVRNLTGRFGEAINEHKKKFNKVLVKKWEKALEEVASLTGLESEKIYNGREGKLVEIVVTKVLSELKGLFLLNVPKQLVGNDKHVESIMSFIDPKFNDTSIIGIYGMGGIGKTTLAKVLYNKLYSHYESRSFVADIRETSKVNGIEHIQKQLISNISGDSHNVHNVDHGISIIKHQCRSKKALILLDDVDDDKHLKALVEDSSWLKAGSVVIITTRDESILNRASVSHKYRLDELPWNQSLVLFSRHAFRKDCPPSDYKLISYDIVSTTGGLPLALEVIGSFLSTSTKEVWKATSEKLKKVLDKGVEEKLRISYDALVCEDKQIFLDIACFFIGSSKQNPIYMWDACDFFPIKGIELLSLRSLIKIGEDGTLMMHDQLRDLGREIVRLQNLMEPQKRSRVWLEEDAKYVFDENKGTEKIEALRLQLYHELCLGLYHERVSYTTENFKELTQLRFLQLHNVNLTGEFHNLLPQLRWLQWTGCQSDFELTNFYLKNLVVLNLSWSRFSKDWRGWSSIKMATKLKVLDLSYCDLRTIPDLSSFNSLEILILKSCWYLEEIHRSIGDIKTLISLDVSYCSKLKGLPLGIDRMENLKELLINDTDIQEIHISRGCLTKLETPNTSKCGLHAQLPNSSRSFTSLTQLNLSSTKIEELPEFIGSLEKLDTLNASYCALLAHIPNSIGELASLSCLNLMKCQKLAQLPDSIGSLMSLSRLLLSECHSLSKIPNSIKYLTLLTELHLKSTAIEELPESIGSLKKLQTLDASYCASLAHIPNSIGHLTSLSRLHLMECPKLAQLPDSIDSLVSLPELSLSGCDLLRKIPDSIKYLTLLTELHLKSTAIKELPESIGFLKNLKTLNACCCASLAHIPDSIGDLTSLSHLDLMECPKLAQLPNSIGSLVSLSHLVLSGCHSLKKIPDSIEYLTLLTKLHLKSTAIEELPKSIGSLKNLKTLDASYCASLADIPDSIGNLASLSCLNLTECQKLAQLPDSIGSLTSLEWLFLSECHSLSKIPNSIKYLTLLTELHLKSTAIEELPEFFGSLKKLKTLDASYCASLAHIPNSIGHLASLYHLHLMECPKLAQLPDFIGSLVSLPQLSLSGCHSLRKIPNSIEYLTLLTELHLKSTAIKELPESIGFLKNLKTLNACCCASLAHIPDSIGDLTSLSRLDLMECPKLAQLPNSISSLVSLPQLSLSGCHSLRQIPNSIKYLTLLTELHLKSTAIKELPESIGFLKNLETLDASYCALLAHIPNSIGYLASLVCLNLTECQKLAQLPNSIGSLVSLRRLFLSGCHSLRPIPDSIGKLTTLTELHLKSMAIEELPAFIGNMQNLKMLDISGTLIMKLLDDLGILAELQGLRASRWKEGTPSNNGQLVSPTNLDSDKLQKLSRVSSCLLAQVLLKRPKTSSTNNSAMDYQTTESDHVLKRSRSFGISDEVNTLPEKILPITCKWQSLGQSSYSSNDLPRNVVITLSQGSLVKSMDFHPVQQILLLAGTNTGDVIVREVGSHSRIVVRNFKVWDLGTCSAALQASLANDYKASVNRVTWSPCGILFGVAYSKHMVHIYLYLGGGVLKNHLEIEAHVGSVNDLAFAFSYPNNQLCVVTCGEDRLIKVWDAVTGAKQFCFEGHEAPVYSICPHHIHGIQLIFSSSTDGIIKSWLYDNMGPRIHYDAPGRCSSLMMAFSADRTRLFMCGTNKEGESHLVEYNDYEGAVKRTYHGLGKRSGGVVQFDTTKNRFLAAGDEFMVKIWDMDDNNLLTSIDADGGLPALPCIRFNKEGNLLAVSTSDNGIKILANSDGISLLRTVENRLI